MQVSITIPAHNEEKRIGKTLELYSDYFDNLRKNGKLDYELIIVINNTQDRTEEIVNRAIGKNPRIRYLKFEKAGKGFAVIEGFKDALKRNNSLIGFVDADAATSPDAFYELIKKVGRYDGAIASRYLKGSVVKPKPTLARVISSRVFNMFLRALLQVPYRDTQCGAKIFRRDALSLVLPGLSFSKWAFDVDLLYNLRKKGFRIKEVPTVWADKMYSTINFAKAGPWMAIGVIRLRMLNSPLKSFLSMYDFLVKRFVSRFL